MHGLPKTEGCNFGLVEVELNKAIVAYRWSIDLAPTSFCLHVHLVDAHIVSGRIRGAEAKARELLQLQMNYSTETFFE